MSTGKIHAYDATSNESVPSFAQRPSSSAVEVVHIATVARIDSAGEIADIVSQQLPAGLKMKLLLIS